MEGWKDGTKRECQRRKQKNAQSVDNKSAATSHAQTLIAYFAANKTRHATQRHGIGRSRLQRWQPRRAPQKAVLSIILAYYRQQSSQYRCNMSVLCLYLLFRAIIDRLPFATPSRYAVFSKNFF